MMRRLRKFLSLPLREKRLVALAAIVVVVVRVALVMLPFRWLQNRILNRAGTRADAPRDAIGAERVAWAVSAVSRFVPGATCLTQALATQWLLGRVGMNCTLRLGVRRNETGDFAAHAWIEHAGRVLIGGGDVNLGDFAQLPTG